jgi:hypothetical protein
MFLSVFCPSPCLATADLSELSELSALVKCKGAWALPGCPMKMERFEPILRRAMSRGYVHDHIGQYVLEGFRHGFDLGVDRSQLHGTRVFRNYPSAIANRGSVSAAVSSRVRRHKTLRLGLWSSILGSLKELFGNFYVFPMGAVPKPHAPAVYRPTSDHTRTGLNAATILGILGHSLDAYKQLEFLLSQNTWMTVADVDDAFSYIPLTPWLWAYMIFRWFPCDDDASDELYVYVNLFADFGTSGAPGTFKVILVDVFVQMARSEFVITIPIVIYVDDVALISASESEGNVQMANLKCFTRDVTGLEWKDSKELSAAQLQLYVGFNWNTQRLVRSLPELKVISYLDCLLEAGHARTLTKRDRQSLAGKAQRVIMTLPPGAACLVVNCYRLTVGLLLPWQTRRTTRGERQDYLFLHDLLKYNQGRGYYSYDGFLDGPGFRGDASKSRAGARGGWVCADGHYDFYVYGGSASRKPIDFLEGDTTLRCCVDNAHRWQGLFIPAGIDNMAFEKSAEAGRSRAARLNDVLRGTFVLQLQHNFILGPYWLSSEENYLADDLSRDRELSFISRAYDFVMPHFPLVRHPDAGRVVTLAANDYLDAMKVLRQTLKQYSSNYTGDGPSRGAGVGGDAQLLSISYAPASVFDGCPPEFLDRLDEVMDNRLRPSSLRKAVAGFRRWANFATEQGWDSVIPSRDPPRGGRMAAWILSMLDDTSLVYNSISTYVWGMRTMHTLQHQSDPAMGVEFFRELMRSVSVLSAVPGEPRKRVELDVVAALLTEIMTSHWDDRVQVQLGLVTLLCLFTFSRTECPCPKNFTGEDSWDPRKHWEVADFSLRRSNGHWVLWVRFKAIKQDPRLERPQARHADPNLPDDLLGGPEVSKDWVPLGDVPDSPLFSIAKWYMRFVQLVGRERSPSDPMFLAADGVRPYTYRAFSSEFKAACMRNGGSERDAPHGLRVLGYNLSKHGNGLDITVAHGGWSEDSDGHSRYYRCSHTSVLGVPAGMLGVHNVFASSAVRQPHTGAVRGTPSVLPIAPSDAVSDDEPSAVPETVNSDLPQGYSRERRVTVSGREYFVYFGPDGSRFTSKPQCWRAYSEASSLADDLAPVDPESDLTPHAAEVVPVSSASPSPPSDNHAAEVVPVSSASPSPPSDNGSSSGGSPLRPVPAFRRVTGRSRLCNKLDPSKANMCSLPFGHDGLCDFEVLHRTRTVRP